MAEGGRGLPLAVWQESGVRPTPPTAAVQMGGRGAGQGLAPFVSPAAAPAALPKGVSSFSGAPRRPGGQ